MDKLVYIIDDDRVYLKFMQTHFTQMEGYFVEVFSDGDDAIRKLESNVPFMIILDHNMSDPAKDGLYYLSRIKKLRPSIPILLITSDSTESLKKKAISLGAKSLIVKSESFLVQLRTAIDEIQATKKKGFFAKLFK